MVFVAIIYILVATVTFIFIYLKWKHSYWKRLGVPYLEPHPIYGNAKDLIRRKAPLATFAITNYRQLKEQGVKHGGIYMFGSPAWIPIDIDLLKTIMIRDFAHFMNHDPSHDEAILEREPLLLNLFNTTDERRRSLRVKLTPTFTSGNKVIGDGGQK